MEEPSSVKNPVSCEFEAHPKDQCAFAIYNVLGNYGSESYKNTDNPEITKVGSNSIPTKEITEQELKSGLFY